MPRHLQVSSIRLYSACVILAAIRRLSSSDRYRLPARGRQSSPSTAVSQADGMPLANVTQSLEARPTAQMFQEKPQERNGLRDVVLSGTAEFPNKTASLLLAGRQGFRRIPFRPFAMIRFWLQNLSSSASLATTAFSSACFCLPAVAACAAPMSLEMTLVVSVSPASGRTLSEKFSS